VRDATFAVKLRAPKRRYVLEQGIQLRVARPGESWEKKQLGRYADKRGVYVHHDGQHILYVGNTTKGDYGTFGERFRRECQQKASGNSSLYRLLLSRKSPVHTYLLDYRALDRLVDSGPLKLTKPRKALIMEQLLIGAFKPKGNQK